MKLHPKIIPIPLFFLGVTIMLASCDSKDRSRTPADKGNRAPELSHDAAAADKPLQQVLLSLLPVRGNGASSELMSPNFRYAELTQPPGPRLRVDAEFLGTSAKTDRWRLAISPENGPKEIKEVEYNGEPIIVWSQGAQHVLLTKDEFTVFELRKSGKLGEEQMKGTR